VPLAPGEPVHAAQVVEHGALDAGFGVGLELIAAFRLEAAERLDQAHGAGA